MFTFRTLEGYLETVGLRGSYTFCCTIFQEAPTDLCTRRPTARRGASNFNVASPRADSRNIFGPENAFRRQRPRKVVSPPFSSLQYSSYSFIYLSSNWLFPIPLPRSRYQQGNIFFLIRPSYKNTHMVCTFISRGNCSEILRSIVCFFSF